MPAAGVKTHSMQFLETTNRPAGEGVTREDQDLNYTIGGIGTQRTSSVDDQAQFHFQEQQRLSR
jgi:hypothetical protein